MEISRVTFNNFNIKRNGIKSNKNDLINSYTKSPDKLFVYPPSYYMKNLSFKGEAFKEKLSQKLKSASEDELFTFFYDELTKKAREQVIPHQVAEDIVQNRIMDIFITINDTDNEKITQEELIDKINDIYDGLKVCSKDYPTKYGDKSIYECISGESAIRYIDVLPDDENHKLTYLKPVDEKTKEKQKQKVSSAISVSDLDNREEKILRERYSNLPLISYVKLGEKFNLSPRIISILIHRALIKMQLANNSLSAENRKKMEDLCKTFNTDKESVRQTVFKNPDILNYSQQDLDYKLNFLPNAFQEEGLTKSKYINACKKAPKILYHSPEVLENNIHGIVNKFSDSNLTAKKYIKACLSHPTLFYTSPETVEKNILNFVEKYKRNGLDVQKYINACCKAPTLFMSSPETIEKNINKLTEKYKQYGLTTDKCIKACCKAPTLFYQSIDTTDKNINDFVKKFEKQGLTKEKYFNACIKNPQLLVQAPDTLAKNVNGLIEKFKDNGLNLKSYLPACLKQPVLFCMSPDTIEKNVKGFVKRYPSLTLDDYLQTCCKKPVLFQHLPEKISEHIDVLNFAFFNTGEIMSEEELIKKIMSDPTELCFSSELLLIKHLILPKIFEKNTKPKGFMRGGHLEEKLEKYLKDNPDKEYEIEVKKYDTQTDCVKLLNDCLKELSLKTTGKDNVIRAKIID